MIYRPSLVILPILLLGVHAQPLKTLINIDLSSPPPKRVRIVPSKAYPGGINYAIKPYSFGTHILGTVKDGDEIIIEGDVTAMSRYIFVVTREDGLRYVRILTRWRRSGYAHLTRVVEFLKLTGSPYRELNRDPTDIDILTQENGQFISVTRSQRNGPDGVPESLECGDQEDCYIHYSIKPELWVTNTIGVVKFGHYIVEGKVDGLMEREVMWYGGLNAPIITITSKYNHGMEVIANYKMEGGQGFKVFKYKRRFFYTCG